MPLLPSAAASRDTGTVNELLPPPPPTAPPAAQGPPRSRSSRPRRGDTGPLCVNGCRRPAATGYTTCCRTCTSSGCVSHGPRCQVAWRQANEPPSPVLEPTSRDAPAASSASSAAASRDAPMRDHQYCVNCRQRRGDERCIRCNLHPLCTRCMPMHGFLCRSPSLFVPRQLL